MTKRRTTRQLLAKIPNVPCLYRHKINGTYYGIKKINGKEKDHSLDTCDRKEAERDLKEWIEQLAKLDAEAQKTTLEQLLQKFEKIRLGKSKSTRDTEAGMIKKLKSSWKHGLDIRVADIKPSMLDEWLAEHEQELMNSSFNRYTLFLKQLFEVKPSRPESMPSGGSISRNLTQLAQSVRSYQFLKEARDNGQITGSAKLRLGQFVWVSNDSLQNRF